VRLYHRPFSRLRQRHVNTAPEKPHSRALACIRRQSRASGPTIPHMLGRDPLVHPWQTVPEKPGAASPFRIHAPARSSRWDGDNRPCPDARATAWATVCRKALPRFFRFSRAMRVAARVDPSFDEGLQVRCGFLGRADPFNHLAAQRRPMEHRDTGPIENLAARGIVVPQPRQFLRHSFKLSFRHAVPLSESTYALLTPYASASEWSPSRIRLAALAERPSRAPAFRYERVPEY